jgi:hypothetical protein
VLTILAVVLPQRFLAGQDPLCQPYDYPTCFRTGEQAELSRLQPAVRREADTLWVRTGGRTTAFVDSPGPGDGLHMWALRHSAAPPGIVVVDELQYLGHSHHVIWIDSGRKQEVECWPFFSPDGRLAFCGFGVTDEGGSRAYVAIYSAGPNHLEQLTRVDLGENQPILPTWLDSTTVTFSTRRIYDTRSPSRRRCVLARVEDRWQLTSPCP